MERHICFICHSLKSGGALKKLDDELFICSKGTCRKTFNSYIKNDISIFNDMTLKGKKIILDMLKSIINGSD